MKTRTPWDDYWEALIPDGVLGILCFVVAGGLFLAALSRKSVTVCLMLVCWIVVVGAWLSLVEMGGTFEGIFSLEAAKFTRALKKPGIYGKAICFRIAVARVVGT